MAAFRRVAANGLSAMRFRSIRDWIALSSISEGAVCRVHTLFVILFAGCAAALAAHILIDLLGDVLLPRDAYDHESHGSRFVALGGAILGGLAVLWRMVCSILAAATSKHCSVHAAAAGNIAAGPSWWFVGRVIVMTTVVVAAMGALDASLGSMQLDDAGDVFGGSLVLGLGVCIALGAVVGIATFCVLRWVAAAHKTIVAAVVSLLCRLVRIDRSIAASRSNEQAFSGHRSLSALVRLAGKRAPPPLLA